MEKITVALCLDDGLGMMFGGRRQSRDRELIGELLDWVGNRRLWIHPYSVPLFEGRCAYSVSEHPLSDCRPGEICFLETESPLPYLHRVGRLVLYRWNYLYPSDLRFDTAPSELGYHLVSTEEFQGSSHEKITKEVYEA